MNRIVLKEEVTMIEFCKTTEEFIEKHTQDVKNIIESKYPNALHFDRGVDDVTHSFIIHALRSRFVEKFISNHPAKAKFSSYCYTVLHNYLCAFEINKTLRRKDFYENTCSLDEVVANESFTRYDMIESNQRESEMDLETIYNKLKEFDEKTSFNSDSSDRKFKSKIPLSLLFKEYVLGSKDADVAKLEGINVSSAAVGARKRILRTQLKKYFAEFIEQEEASFL